MYNARDKARARGMLLGIVFTIGGCMIAGYYGKTRHKQGHGYTDDIVKEHAEYSKIHQDIIKTVHK